MASLEQGKLDQLPDEMFSIIKSASHHLTPRLGNLTLPGRNAIRTPHYLGLTSRGVIPHISQDNFAQLAAVTGVYAALEDFIERAPQRIPPIYKFRPPDGSSPLRRFTALPEETLLVLGARRSPPVAAPPANSNTNTTVAISTAIGFKTLKAEDYVQNVEELGADIVVGLGDIPYGRALGNKRVEKATDRNIEWLQGHVDIRKGKTDEAGFHGQAALFASLLPTSCAYQQYYVDTIVEKLQHEISGLALYNLETIEDLPLELQLLPRLGFTDPSSPHDVLSHIATGLDILTIPFITSATDAGIALDFTFPGPAPGHDVLPLGIDMWSTAHVTDLSPLRDGCSCYACTNHHRAFIQHLLSAKEMLGWVLLQIHNHSTMDLFFSAIRTSITNDTWDTDCKAFAQAYEPQLPAKTGRGPRMRGYQFRSEGPGEQKKNSKPFKMFDEGRENMAETPVVPDESAVAVELEDQGFAEKQA